MQCTCPEFQSGEDGAPGERAVCRNEIDRRGRSGKEIQVVAAVPGLFSADSSGTGQGALLNQDNSYNSAKNAAFRGSIVSLYGTGEGLVSPAVLDGTLNTTVFPKPLLPVKVTLGGAAIPSRFWRITRVRSNCWTRSACAPDSWRNRMTSTCRASRSSLRSCASLLSACRGATPK